MMRGMNDLSEKCRPDTGRSDIISEKEREEET
jgi:hypothetical protein